jgi:hypothetical protein
VRHGAFQQEVPFFLAMVSRGADMSIVRNSQITRASRFFEEQSRPPIKANPER